MTPNRRYHIHKVLLMCIFRFWPVSSEVIRKDYCPNTEKEVVDLSHRKLSEIPKFIPPNTTSLDLSKNKINAAPSNVFYHLHSLLKLNLAYNKLTKLEPRSLSGLHYLCYFDLSNNPLSVNSYPKSVFSFTPNLKVLHMASNAGKFPEEAFRKLNVTQLFVSPGTAYSLYLGSAFSAMIHLKEFHIKDCNIRVLENTTFQAFEKITLTIFSCSSCGLQNIEAGSFLPMNHLKAININGNEFVGLPSAMRALYGITHRNMTDIKLNGVNSLKAFFVYDNFILDEPKAEFIKDICVTSIDLGINYILAVTRTFFSSFRYPLCIKSLSLRLHHIFTFNGGIFQILRFRNLEYLDVRGQLNPSLGRSVQLPGGIRQGCMLEQASKYSKLNNSQVIIQLPPNLSYIDASHSIKEMGSNVMFADTKKLHFFDLSSNGMSNCSLLMKDTQRVSVLNISRIDCSAMDPKVFAGYPRLKILEMAGVRLAEGLLSDAKGILFEHQTQVTNLNIADNGLVHLHKNLFKNLNHVKTLSLANNKLLTVPETFHHLKGLQYLDLSYNSLTHLKQSEILWIEKTFAKTGLSLRLDGNPFACICSTVEFVQWAIQTPVNIINRERITCTLTNGSLVVVVSFKDDLTNFQVQCVSRFWLIFSTTGGSVLCSLLVLSIIGYRYRYNIKYWFLTKCRAGHQYETVNDEEYQFDAFVAYNHHDYRWACFTLREFLEDAHNYRLCLHHRDFPVAESIQQNIVDAVNSSRKIILVVTRQFIDCDWGEFEIQMAGMRAVQEGRPNVVVVILLEDIPVQQMPRSLINMWNHVTFLLWTGDLCDTTLFWERLESAIARP